MRTGDPFENRTKPSSASPTSSDPQVICDRQEEAFRERLQLLIYQWIQTKIPSWQPERSPRYKQASQALNATIPESDNPSRGLVYFKNVFDPFWSNEDLARVHEIAYPWMLMILSPCERFYECEPRLMQMVSNSPRLMIWRPDSPSRTELETLRRLVLTIPSETIEGKPSVDSAIEDVHLILTNLYVRRGQFIGRAFRCPIGEEIGDRSIGQHLSARLATLSLQGTTAIPQDDDVQTEAVLDKKILEWAALVADCPELQNSSFESARERLIAWWMNFPEELSARLPEFPESFMTNCFRSKIKSVEGPLLALKPIFFSLRAGTFSLAVAIEQLARNFTWDIERLRGWKQLLDNLEGFLQWMPNFIKAQEYVRAAFPLGQKIPDQLLASLLQSLNDSCRFLDKNARDEFNEKFSKFKKHYADSYFALHEDARRATRGLRKDEAKIDPVSLHNLELLSGLRYMDKSYLNRVKVLARWMQRNQCTLPLSQILERYPRCFCNFNPCSNQAPADSASRINEIIGEGIEYFRTILRKCEFWILEELKGQQIEEKLLHQITTILSSDSMVHLKPQSIKMLNGIISKHSRKFLSEIRNYRKTSKPSSQKA